MDFQDRSIECIDCHQSFVFTAGEQEFYERKGFRELPKRCKNCRDKRKSRRDPAEDAGNRAAAGGSSRGSHGGGHRELFDATCAACGAPARVPFRPSSGRPVYCRDCYANRSSGGNY